MRVRWKEARSEAGVQRDFEVIERATGEMIIEKVTPPFDELDAPMKELSVSDGRIFRHTDDRGDTRDVPEHLFEQERLGVSPYHLLLDPAGLTHADLEYVSVDGGDKQKRLGFRYLDGYSGHLLVEIDGPSVSPVEIVSRMSFPSDRVRESLGNPRGETDSQYKSVRFVDYRPLDGRLVPHTVIFTNRLLDYTLTLESLELNPEVPDDTFECEYSPPCSRVRLTAPSGPAPSIWSRFSLPPRRHRRTSGYGRRGSGGLYPLRAQGALGLRESPGAHLRERAHVGALDPRKRHRGRFSGRCHRPAGR